MDVTIDDAAFHGACDGDAFGVDLTPGGKQLRKMVGASGLYALVGGATGLPGISAGPVASGAVLRWPDRLSAPQSGDEAGDCFFLLLRLSESGPSEFCGISLHLGTGGPLRARTCAATVSDDGLQGFVTLAPEGYEDRPLTILHTAFAHSHPPGDEVAEYRIIGLPLILDKVRRAPIEIGPDAPNYADMVRAGMSLDDDGIIRLRCEGMAIIFPRPDIGPHACEVGGRVTALRHGFSLADADYDIAEVEILRDGAGDAPDISLSIALPPPFRAVPGRPPLAVGDDVQGIVLFGGYVPALMAPPLRVSG